LFLKFQIEIYQWLVPLVAIFFIWRIISQFRANRRLLIGTVIWVSFWVILGLLAMLPDPISFSIAESLGLKSNINAVIFVWLGFLFIMTYYQSSTIERLERQVTQLVRKVALEKQGKQDLEKEIEERIRAEIKMETQSSPAKKVKTVSSE